MNNTCIALPILLAAAALQACAPGEVPDHRPGADAPGRLVIVGGALQEDNAAVYEAVVEGRDGDGPLCVIPTAGGDPEESMNLAVERLDRYAGVGAAKGILISTADPSRARNPEVAEEIAACSGYFFTGGSQSRIADVFLPAGDTTEGYRALRRRWQEGAVIAGTSAGAAMMSRVMISGGGSDEAVTLGVAARRGEDGVDIRPGMGFFEPIVDQHFLARGRIGRLLVAVADDASPQIGLGIDENTALIVDGGSGLVVGASGIVVVDGRSAAREEPGRTSGLRVELAGAGDVIDLETFRVLRGDGKRPLTAATDDPQLPEDPFARWAFLHLVADFSASTAREAVFTLPNATLRIEKDTDFSAVMAGPTGGVEGVPSDLSAGPFLMDLLQRGPEPLELHRELLDAHLDGDVERWMAIESMDYVSANQGRVTFPEWDERRGARAAYLESTEFEVYRDVREPVIRIADDGSLGWLIAEVEVRGTTTGPDGESEPFHDVWAWVELYHHTQDGWRLVGNVSNRRPAGGEAAEG